MTNIKQVMTDLQETAKSINDITDRINLQRQRTNSAKDEALGHMRAVVDSVSADIDVLKEKLISELNIALKAMSDNYAEHLLGLFSLQEPMFEQKEPDMSNKEALSRITALKERVSSRQRSMPPVSEGEEGDTP